MSNIDSIDCLTSELAGLEPTEVEVPTGNPTIAVLTRSEPRHRRFACRIQQAFGERVVRWYEIRNGPSASAYQSRIEKFLKTGVRYMRERSFQEILKAPRKLALKVYRKMSSSEGQKHRRRLEKAKEKVVEPSLPELVKSAHLEPQPVTDPNSDTFASRLHEVSPMFLLTLGGPLYRPKIIDAADVAINQHAGWSPHYKGTGTIYWALYHRDIRRLGSTVHLLNEGADAGAIFVRSFPALTGNETPEECFLRVVVLGTELMIGVVEELCSTGRVTAYRQEDRVGRTYTSADMDEALFRRLRCDLEDEILSDLLDKMCSY